MYKTINVLLIEDNSAYARLIRELLAESRGTIFVLEHSLRLSDGLLHLGDRRHDVVLLDLGLPDSQGLDTLLRVQEKAPGVPIIVLTGLDDEELAFKAIRMDAQDYIVKGQADSDLLVRAILYAIERKRTKEALRASEEKYRELVEHANSIILKVDTMGTITFFNEFAQAFFGFAESEIVGRNILGTIVPYRDSSGKDLTLMMNDILRDPDRYLKNENENIRKDGTRVWVAWTNKAMRDSEGRITGILAVGQDISERRKMEEIIRQQASHDALTGLPNRRMFTDRLTFALNQAHRYHKQIAVVFMDLDHFKNINDSFGHDAGDQLLKDVAERLGYCVRETDTMARIGGDEFNILLPDIHHAEDTTIIVEKIMAAFQRPFSIQGHDFHITASMGISIYPDDGKFADTLLKNADAAMYHVKEQGRNNYKFYNPAINTRTIERMILEKNLRKTLECGGLVVHYQPQVATDTKQIVCAEALVRWQHPELGLLNPMKFIPLAEETGLIIPIGKWVLRAACAQNKAWQEAGYPPLCVTVNLSARQFQQSNLAEMVAQVLHETNLDAEWLELEITESTAMQDIGHTIPNLSRLTEMGIRFAIDDFGTGCTSLSYLKSLPIRKLKIDRSFISGLTTDPDDQAIVTAVIALAHNLRLKVVAEGVETEDQLLFLRSSRCDEVQVYLLSEPVPVEEFEKLMT